MSMRKMSKVLIGSRGVVLLAFLLGLAFAPSAHAVTPEPGDLVISDFNGAFDGPVGMPPGGRIVKVDPVTGAQTMISSGGLLDAPWEIAIDAGGDILVGDPSFPDGGAIIKVDPDTGAQTVAASGGFISGPSTKRFLWTISVNLGRSRFSFRRSASERSRWTLCVLICDAERGGDPFPRRAWERGV